MEDLSPKKDSQESIPHLTKMTGCAALRFFNNIRHTSCPDLLHYCLHAAKRQDITFSKILRPRFFDNLQTYDPWTRWRDLSPSCPKGRPPVRQWNIRIPTAQTSVRASTWAERKHCERKGCTSLNTVSQNAKQQMMNKLMAKNLRALVCLLRREVHWRVDSAYQRLIVQLLQWKGSQRKQFECMDERVWKLGTIS